MTNLSKLALAILALGVVLMSLAMNWSAAIYAALAFFWCSFAAYLDAELRGLRGRNKESSNE